MRLWIAVHLPHLPLETFLPRGSFDPGCAIIDKDRVLAISGEASGAGIRIGARRGSVTMIAPNVVTRDRDEARERESLNAVATALLQYTPQVATADEDVLLMDVGASLTLFAGPRALCRRIRADMRTLGFTASISSAPTAQGAWMLARARTRQRRTLTMGTVVRRLDGLHVLVLPPARRFADWLDGLGCYSVGDLRKLPRPGLQRRCGRALLDVLDAAYGLAPEMHEWIEAPATFKAQLEIFDRVEKADELLIGAHGLVLQLMGWLSAHQLAVRSVELKMLHERGRAARPPSSLTVALGEAVWHDEHLVRLLKERLGRQTLEAPVIGLVLEAVDLVPMAAPSESLFPEPGGTEGDRQQLFEVLAARLGQDNVLKPDPQADYRPEVANKWAPVQTPMRDAEMLSRLPANMTDLARPTWILDKPIQLLIRSNRPYYGSPLKMVSAPERIEAGWWSTPECRDYFIAEGSDHSLYWVYRERYVNEGGEPEPRWFLHGLFG